MNNDKPQTIEEARAIVAAALKPSHSPVPWQAFNDGNGMTITTGLETAREVPYYILQGYELFRLPYPKGKPEQWETDKANAEHLVKCVNMHDELIALLEKITDVGYGFDEHDKAKDLINRSKGAK